MRDLASIATYPLSVEFRSIEIVAIEVRSPVKVQLRLVGIGPEPLAAFQEICRGLIRSREDLPRLPDIATMTEQEAQRLKRHITALQHAPIPLKRVRVTQQ